MAKKTQWEEDCEEPMDVQENCHTERGQGRKMATGDGRTTIKDRSEGY